MFTLVAKEANGERSISIEVVPGKRLKLGRLPDCDVPVEWDLQISREHAVVELVGSRLRIACLEMARNPILSSGTKVREVFLDEGQRCQIGQTLFRLVVSTDTNANPDLGEESSAFDEHAFDLAELKQFNFGNFSQQMALLCGLPEMIAKAHSDAEFGCMATDLLLKAMPQAVAVAAVHFDLESVNALLTTTSLGSRVLKPQMMRVATREEFDGQFVPSRRLISRAFQGLSAVVHIASGATESVQVTMAESLDWAFCVPVPSETKSRWCLYVSGRGGDEGDTFVTHESLEPQVRFTQLLAQFIGSVRQVRSLQEQKTQLSAFFSPKVIQSLTGGDATEALTPSERDISVLFCDVRGFSRKSEKYKHNLKFLLNCVKEALGAMTHGILQFDGTIADFQGDAALGFWGWPVALEEGPIPACLAALAIQNEFLHPERHERLLDGFSVGIGIAHGRAIAGQIGTAQQAKIGVFGPVVNQGSRLEGLSRHFGVSICIDETTAEFVRSRVPKEQARVRALARVRPKGMDTPVNVFQLVPPEHRTAVSGFDQTIGQDKSFTGVVTDFELPGAKEALISDREIVKYEAALKLVIQGYWPQAITQLQQVSDDGAKAFLLERMQRTNNQPPDGWDGAFSLAEK